jgi:glycosyltransferase involved in cell wall biosynthesis
MSHIIYLSTARLPTEKANGFQVMKMCEAMAGLGHDVELLHPWRYQANSLLTATNPFVYYGVRPTFRLRTLSNLDIVPLERWLPDLPFLALYGLHELGWALLAAWRAAKANPDLIYTRDAPCAYWATRLGRACVFEAHIPPGGRGARIVRSFSRRPSTRAVITLTKPTAADLEAAGVPGHKLEVLPDAADLAAFADAPSKEHARRQLDLPLRRPIIGYIGRFETMGREKGVRDLVRAMAVSELRKLDPLLLCVGGPMDPVGEYTHLARSLGVPSSALRFVDRVPNPEVPTWLAALDVGALPAPAERSNERRREASVDRYPTATSPLKLFEYMAAGLPIVAADLPGVREVLDDGENAVLVPSGDPEALARAFSRTLEDAAVARGLGDRARRAAAEYTWSRRAERALASALGGSQAARWGTASRGEAVS